MITTEQRTEMVRYWWLKARDSLSSARREFEAGSHSFAMNRLYYAAFYGVCAVLLDRQQSFRKHSGVRAAFHRQFIKTGRLDIKWGRLYHVIMEATGNASVSVRLLTGYGMFDPSWSWSAVGLLFFAAILLWRWHMIQVERLRDWYFRILGENLEPISGIQRWIQRILRGWWN